MQPPRVKPRGCEGMYMGMNEKLRLVRELNKRKLEEVNLDYATEIEKYTNSLKKTLKDNKDIQDKVKLSNKLRCEIQEYATKLGLYMNICKRETVEDYIRGYGNGLTENNPEEDKFIAKRNARIKAVEKASADLEMKVLLKAATDEGFSAEIAAIRKI
jgi:ribosomal protein S17E